LASSRTVKKSSMNESRGRREQNSGDNDRISTPNNRILSDKPPPVLGKNFTLESRTPNSKTQGKFKMS
jgi:hypothetical protein